MNGFAEFSALLESHRPDFVDVRVTDLVGRFRHVTIPAARFTEALAESGIGIDGSNYGYRRESGSDMIVVPDLSTAYVDKREDGVLVCVIGDVCDATTVKPAPADPRGLACRAQEYLRESGLADDLVVSPEFEFYVFDEAWFDSDPGRSCAEVVPFEGCDHRSSGRPAFGSSSAYHAPLPQDRLFALRNEMVRRLETADVPVKYHHHEVGPYGQLEIELGFAPLLQMADATQVVKSIVRSAADEAGLTATFLPKPLYGEAGNGLHLHQYLTKNGENLFAAGNGLSDLALQYVGGVLSHGRSLMGLTNPSTNSYRRLVPGYEAPVRFTYGPADRTAAVRIPAYARREETRIELRTMDATCNPYLAFTAVLMAGIDGITDGRTALELGFESQPPASPDSADDSKRTESASHTEENNPGRTSRAQVDRGTLASSDSPLYVQGRRFDPETGVPSSAVMSEDRIPPGDLLEALSALAADHAYLLRGEVFRTSDIARWIGVKEEEEAAVAARPHPHEFTLYYDL